MDKTCGFVRRATVLALGFVFVAWSTAFGGGYRLRDDQIPFGPEGTIGRGTDSAAEPPYSVRGGIPLWPPGGSWPGGGDRTLDPTNSEPSYPNPIFHGGYYWVPRSYAPPAAAGPYLTNEFYEPGDGYRSPLYYNPATRTYFYYPVRR
jgi:hypothetical protein